MSRRLFGCFLHEAKSRSAESTRPRFGSGFEQLDDRVVPSVVYNNTFNLSGGASVTETVIDSDPSHPGQWRWDFVVTNQALPNGMSTFAVPAEDPTMVSAYDSDPGWTGSVGTLLGNPNLVSWQANGAPLAIGGSADFWFTTAPTGFALTNGFVADAGLTNTFSDLLAIPTSAPVPNNPPPPPSVKVFSTTDNDKTEETLGKAINDINNGKATFKGQAVTLIQFAAGLTGKTITLTQGRLPTIANTMIIDGEDKNVTITRDATKGIFGLFQVGIFGQTQVPSVTISNLTLTGGDAFGTTPGGGAILSYGKLVLTGCTIQNNSAEFGGGVDADNGTLSITNCNISNNSATFDGGGVYIFTNATAVNITNGLIENNQADRYGGGIFILGGKNVPINVLGVLISANGAADSGGGIDVFNNQSMGGSPILTLGANTVITGNYVTGAPAQGGGVYFGAGTLVLIGPTSTQNGAAIYENTANTGAGLYLVTGTVVQGNLNLAVYGNFNDNVAEGA
jgi:hypothetical protein